MPGPMIARIGARSEAGLMSVRTEEIAARRKALPARTSATVNRKKSATVSEASRANAQAADDNPRAVMPDVTAAVVCPPGHGGAALSAAAAASDAG